MNEDRIVYIGSTIQNLADRMAQHRASVTRKTNLHVYQVMAENGVEHFHIELLCDFPCERREQLLAEEGRHIRLHETHLSGTNQRLPGPKTENEKLARKTYCKQYYSDNRDDFIKKRNDYYLANKQKIKEYVNNNRDAINAQRRERALKKRRFLSIGKSICTL